MPEQRSSAGQSFSADALTRFSEGTSSEDRMSPPGMMSESQLWEEGGRLAGKASQMTPPQGLAIRQVVDLSPPGNTAVAELPVANGLSTLPNPGKQEPAGSESARTGTAAQSTGQESASSDSVFANVCFVSAVGDSQVKGPLSLRQAHSTGKMSVETRGRRQAGNDTRAGSATPPNPSPAQAVEIKSGGSPAGEKPVMPGKQGPAIPEDPLRPEQIQQGDRPVHNLPFISVPGAIEPRKNTSDKGEALPSAEVFLSEVPPPAQRGNNFDSKAPQTTRRPARQSSEPQVQIGLLEVVVVSLGQGARAGQGKKNISSNLASRLYLRGL